MLGRGRRLILALCALAAVAAAAHVQRHDFLGTTGQAASAGTAASAGAARQEPAKASSVTSWGAAPGSAARASSQETHENSSNPNACLAIYVVLVVGFIIEMVGDFLMCDEKIVWCGVAMNLIGALVASIYVLYHRMVQDWWAGKPMNAYCRGVIGAALVMYIFAAVGACLVLFFGTKRLIRKMRAKTAEAAKKLKEDDAAYLSSEEFKIKCEKAFVQADKDNNGKLDLNELRDVVLFPLDSKQQQKVENEDLFKQAFDVCDKDKNHYIDQAEFLEVMKYVRAHAMADA